MNDDLCLWSARWMAGSQLPIRSVSPPDGWVIVECLGMAPEDRVWMRASIISGAEATVRRMVNREWPDNEKLNVWLRLSVHQGRTSISHVGPADAELGIITSMVARANQLADAEDRAALAKAKAWAAVAAAKARERYRLNKRAEERRIRIHAAQSPPTVEIGRRAQVIISMLRKNPMITGSAIADHLGWDRIKTHLLLLKMESDGLTVRERERWRVR